MSEKLAILGGPKIRKDPFPPYPIMGKEERKGVLEVLETGLLSGFIAKAGDNFLGGPKVRQFEKEFCNYFGVKHAIAVNSGTSGLHIAVAAAGIGPGDEVIVPPYTMSATVTCVLMQNAIPVFADIQDDIFCLDPACIRKAITPQTKAIIVVHLFGHPADMDLIMPIAKEHNLVVIEDSAQAPGAIYKGEYVGTIGDMGVFSFNQHKTITTGEGGVVVTNNDEFALKMQLVRNHGEAIVAELGQEDIVNTLGWNYRMTELEAAIGIAQFQKLDTLTQPRIELADFLTSELSKFDGVTPPIVYPHAKHVYFVYAMKYDETKVGVPRDIFVKALTGEGIPFSGGYVRPIYLEPIFQKRLCYGEKGCPFSCPYFAGEVSYQKGICPIAERLNERELMATGLCRYPLTIEDMKDVSRAFEKVMENIEIIKRKYKFKGEQD